MAISMVISIKCLSITYARGKDILEIVIRKNYKIRILFVSFCTILETYIKYIAIKYDQ